MSHSRRRKHVVILGGGITGLATARALEQLNAPVDITLLERAPRLGGNLGTLSYRGFTLDGGPDSWVSAKPQATALARALGLGDDLIGTRPGARKVYIVKDNRLFAMPEGLILGIPTSLRPFAETDLFGFDTKLRALIEPLIPAKTFTSECDDESIAAFVTRRLGPELCDRIVGPLLGGIFAGNPENLSVRACAPQLVEAEAKFGSLILAMRALRKSRKAQAQQAQGESHEPSTFTSLKRGLGDLVLHIVHQLRHTHIETSQAATAVRRLPPGDPSGRWAIETAERSFFADDLVMTVPAHATAHLARDFDPGLASLMAAGVSYVSTATVFLAYANRSLPRPLDAVGFLVPKSENRNILACTFVSSKWAHRAPAGHALLRVFIGGAGAEHHLTNDDEALTHLAREPLRDLLGIEKEPVFSKVFRFHKASPQPSVGHLGRMRRILERAENWPGLYVGGNGFAGTGISDAIQQGLTIAEKISRSDSLEKKEATAKSPSAL